MYVNGQFIGITGGNEKTINTLVLGCNDTLEVANPGTKFFTVVLFPKDKRFLLKR